MWLYESVIYQIYPIGFCGASHTNDGYESNDILKMVSWVDYLKGLGVNCVLFNPILDSDSHGYDTRDFGKIDKRLGTNEDFKKVCKALNDAGIRVVLDGVFNHVGRGFWAFQDVMKNRQNSQYCDWFQINFDGNSNYNDGFWYEGWEGHYELVKLNLNNPKVVEHLLENVKMYIEEFQISGLRLDVAYCLEREFMKQLRSFCQGLKSDFALIGEVLFGDYNTIVNDEMLHSCTNYECYKGLYSSMNDYNLFEISHSLNRQFGSEDWCIYRGKHLMTFVDNHDVSRIYSILNNKALVGPAYALLLAMPGVPCIYYGSEWAEPGEKQAGGDWQLRPCFEGPKPNELTEELKKYIALRKSNKSLNYGSYTNVVVTNRQLLIKREFEGEAVYFGINIDENPFTFNNHELNGEFVNLLCENQTQLSGQLEIAGHSVIYLRK